MNALLKQITAEQVGMLQLRLEQLEADKLALEQRLKKADEKASKAVERAMKAEAKVIALEAKERP